MIRVIEFPQRPVSAVVSTLQRDFPGVEISAEVGRREAWRCVKALQESGAVLIAEWDAELAPNVVWFKIAQGND